MEMGRWENGKMEKMEKMEWKNIKLGKWEMENKLAYTKERTPSF